MQIDMLFDFSSPNAYLVHKLVPGIEARTGQRITYVPCLLGGIFKATGNDSPLFVNAHVENKIAYEKLEFERFIKKHALSDFQFNANFPLRTVFLMRAACTFETQSDLRRFAETAMAMAWEQNVNVADTPTVIEKLTQAGFDGPGLWDLSQQEAVKQKLFANTEAAVKRGAFGMPTFYVGDEMIFGKERLQAVEDEILRQLKA